MDFTKDFAKDFTKDFANFTKHFSKDFKHDVPTMSLRGPAAQHLNNEARRAEFDGTGRTGYQKCPSIFFILCGYIEHVYIYLYIFSKIAANILIGFKI